MDTLVKFELIGFFIGYAVLALFILIFVYNATVKNSPMWKEKKRMNNTIKKIKKYKELKADITDIDIKLQELEDEMIGISASPQGERTSQTYKITSQVELQAEKHLKDKDKLLEHKARLQREIARIDNALTILKDEERDIIQMALIEQKKYALLEVKYNLTYGRIKQMEKEALKKIDKYLV